MQILNAEYWDTIYQAEKMSWDIGYVSTPLKAYFDQLTDQSIRILVAGSGNAYEAEYLWELGFKNVFILDFSIAAIQSFLKRYPHFPKQNILHEDFFDHQSHYDLIVEQTFLTSLLPPQRKAYAQKMHQLLNPNGKLMGLVFNHLFPFEGPPFGGIEQEYRILFQPYFQFVVFEMAYNSIKPRKGRELFFILKKKETN